VQLDADGAFGHKGIEAVQQPVPEQPQLLDLSEARVLRLGRVLPCGPVDLSRVVFMDYITQPDVLRMPSQVSKFTLLFDDKVRTHLH
jgi:hypothetical protein